MICTYPKSFLLNRLHLLLLLHLPSVLLAALRLRCVLAALRLLLGGRAWADRLADSLLDRDLLSTLVLHLADLPTVSQLNSTLD